MREGTDSGDVLQPFLTVLEGGPVSYQDLVSAGRRIAGALVAHGRPVSLCGESHWAGAWDLEKLTDGEAVDWGLWVATKSPARVDGHLDARRRGLDLFALHEPRGVFHQSYLPPRSWDRG